MITYKVKNGVCDIKVNGSMLEVSEEVENFVNNLVKYDSDYAYAVLMGLADCLSHKTIIEKLEEVYTERSCEIIDFIQ